MALVGSDNFLQEEGSALLKFDVHNSVVSLSGSNPLHSAAMSHIRSMGLVIYLDVLSADILSWTESMKLDRIVGLSSDKNLQQVIENRLPFYEQNFDVRVVVGIKENPLKVAEKVVKAVHSYKNASTFISTRESDENNSNYRFNHVVERGLAPDGGLYVPSTNLRHVDFEEWRRFVSCSYSERAKLTFEKLLHPLDISPQVISSVVDKAYSANNFETSDGSIVPVNHLYQNVFLAEQFHGPTASFKDLALQVFPLFFQQASNDLQK